MSATLLLISNSATSRDCKCSMAICAVSFEGASVRPLFYHFPSSVRPAFSYLLISCLLDLALVDSMLLPMLQSSHLSLALADPRTCSALLLELFSVFCNNDTCCSLLVFQLRPCQDPIMQKPHMRSYKLSLVYRPKGHLGRQFPRLASKCIARVKSLQPFLHLGLHLCFPD